MLKYIYGVMGAGKTTTLVNTHRIYQRKGLKPIVIKPKIDDREGIFSGWGYTSSRLIPDKKIPVYYFSDIREIEKLDFGAILVDEAQFLTREQVIYLRKQNKPVIAFGLKSDINGRLFEGSSTLMVFADEVKELDSICETPNCTNKATMHLRFVDGKPDNGSPVLIEKGNVKYLSVCIKCWLDNQKQK